MDSCATIDLDRPRLPGLGRIPRPIGRRAQESNDYGDIREGHQPWTGGAARPSRSDVLRTIGIDIAEFVAASRRSQGLPWIPGFVEVEAILRPVAETLARKEAVVVELKRPA